MKYTVERTFSDVNRAYRGAGYRFYEDVFQDLIHMMVERIGHPFPLDDPYHRPLIFVMNSPLYNEFCIACAATCHDSNMYRGIRITLDKDLYISDSQSPIGKVRLIYKDDEPNPYYRQYCVNDVKVTNELFIGLDRGHGFQRLPHIDHVKFNGPATIVFWKDGTKTVVKYDGKGHKDYRQAILYAFIRKIYGEGRPYHDILNEIENVMEQELWMPLPEKEDIK